MPYIYSRFGPRDVYAENSDSRENFNPNFLTFENDEIVAVYEHVRSIFGLGSDPNTVEGFYSPDLTPDHYEHSSSGNLFEHDPTLTLLADGNVVVSWEIAYYSGHPTLEDYEVAFAILDQDGNVIVGEQLANSTVEGGQSDQITQALDDGGFVMAWNSEEQDGSGSGVFTRVYGADGQTVAAEFQVNTTTQGDQTLSDVTIGADGRILVTWTSADSIVARLFSETGTPVGPEVSLGTGAEPNVSITAMPGGGYIAAVSGAVLDTSGSGVIVQRLSEDGGLLGSPTSVNTTTNGDQGAQQILTLSDGGFAVIWESEGQDGSDTGIFARFFDATGTAITEELQINQVTAGRQSDIDAAVLSNGDVVISWTSEGPPSSIQYRTLSADGAFLGDELPVNPGSQDNQFGSSIEVLSDGRFEITWSTMPSTDSAAILSQTFVQNQVGTGTPTIRGVARLDQTLSVDVSSLSDADGLDMGTATYRWLLDGLEVSDQETYTVDSRDAGGTLVVEVTIRDGLGIPQTYASEPTAPIGSTVMATAGADDLTGTAGSDFFDGGAAGDIIRGLEGDDSLFGGLGDDYLHGGADDDLLIGDEGDDTLQGGFQEDTLIGGDGDDLILGDAGFDMIIGGTGNDTLNGGAQADVVFGGDGDDLVLGEGGLDILNGDAGNDTLNGGGGEDVLRGGGGDDDLTAGAGNDILYGDTGNDLVEGDDGFDLLFGGHGHDTLNGGSDNDTMSAGAGFDLLIGGTGADHMDGGDQADNLLGGTGNDTLLGGNGFDRLFGESGDDVVIGGHDTDGLFGQEGNDTIWGQWGNDRLYGGVGNDVLDGGANDDHLSGGAGFDTITGSFGDDRLTGNFNADTFVFADNHGQDVITDFDAHNRWERIDLRSIDAVTSYEDLLINHMSQVGNDVEIDTETGLITLIGVNLGDLDEGDFLL